MATLQPKETSSVDHTCIPKPEGEAHTHSKQCTALQTRDSPQPRTLAHDRRSTCTSTTLPMTSSAAGLLTYSLRLLR